METKASKVLDKLRDINEASSMSSITLVPRGELDYLGKPEAESAAGSTKFTAAAKFDSGGSYDTLHKDRKIILNAYSKHGTTEFIDNGVKFKMQGDKYGPTWIFKLN